MANKKPQIKLTVPETAKVGEVVTIDPTGSIDPDGQIVGFSAGVLNAELRPVGIVFNAPGEYEVFGKITDAKNKSDQATAIVTITEDAPPPVEISLTPTTLPELQVGKPVDVQLDAQGGVAPYLFYPAPGSDVPPGLTLSDAGHLAGTPIDVGAFALEVVASDAEANSGSIEYTGTITAAPTPPSGDVLTENDFEYLGALRMPQEIAGMLTFAYGGIAGRKVDGKVRIFISGDEVNYHAPIAELEDPGTYDRNWQSAPQMRFVQWISDPYQGKRGTYLTVDSAMDKYQDLVAAANREADPARADQIRQWAAQLAAWIKPRKNPKAYEYYEFPIGQSVIGALYWDDPSKRLFWTYYDVYNVSGRPDWGLGATALAGDAWTADGPWRFKCTNGDGYDCYGPWRGLSLAVRPDTGELLTGSTLISGNVGSPWGCDCYGGGRFPAPGAPYDVDLVMPVRYLEHYCMIGEIGADGRVIAGKELRSQRRRLHMPVWEYVEGQQVLNVNNAHYGFDSWREVDGSGIAVWFDNVNGKSGAMFLGACCGSPIQDPANPEAAHEWYASALNNYTCMHGHPAPVQVTGPVSRAQFSAMWIYKIPDLLAVSRGEMLDYKPEPVAEVNLQDKWGVHAAPRELMGGNKNFAGTYFDRDTRLLYTMAPKCDNVTAFGAWSALVHVFRVGG